MNVHVTYVKQTLYDALQQMNQYKVKFLIAVNEEGRVMGTLTDGDVRRALLRGMELSAPVEGAVCMDFTAVSDIDGLKEVLVAFQDPRIEFLPVLDEEKKLRNIITRRGLNVLLLHDQKFRMDFDFSTLNENSLEHEIFARPWGFYKTTILNDMFQAKVIHVLPKQALSLQSHQRREEYWIVVNGEGVVQIGESVHPVVPGSYVFIPKGCKHRLTNTSQEHTLILTEVQLGDYFGEDDIFRYEDKYARV